MSSALDLLPDYPYLPRLTIKGRIYLSCPSCGTVTVNRVRTGQHRLHCRGAFDEDNDCRHSNYGFGIRLFPLTKGNYLPPHDHTIVGGLRESFPVGEMFRWKRGEMTHQLVPGGRELARELVKQIRGRAVGGVMGLGYAFEQVVGEWGLELSDE